MTSRLQDDFEVIAEFSNPVEAQIAVGRLISDGIDARIENHGALGTPILNPGHAGGVVVLVRREDSEIASVLLGAIDEEYEPEVPPEYAYDAEISECPECGSTNKKFQRGSAIARIFSMSSHHPERTGHRWICRDCRHIWIVEKQP